MKSTRRAGYAVKRSRPGLGLGLFATQTFNAGDFVAEYTGMRIPTAVADSLKTRYIVEIDEDWAIDGSSRSNIARYINHSCQPNTEAEYRDGKVCIYAIRTIREGDEFTIDYGDEYFEEFIRPVGCKCIVCEKRVFARGLA